MSRSGGLPPPSHPPPPPPTSGQVVAVEIGPEEAEHTPPSTDQLSMQPDNIMSSFRPADNAKLYASPQDVNSVAFRCRTLPTKTQVIYIFLNIHTNYTTFSTILFYNGQIRKSQSMRAGNGGSPFQAPNSQTADDPTNQYAQPFKPHRSHSSASNKVSFVNRQVFSFDYASQDGHMY